MFNCSSVPMLIQINIFCMFSLFWSYVDMNILAYTVAHWCFVKCKEGVQNFCKWELSPMHRARFDFVWHFQATCLKQSI